jgi:hypothetical protein
MMIASYINLIVERDGITSQAADITQIVWETDATV